MKTTKILIMLLTLLLAGSAFAQTAWEQYLELPTPENAARVQQALYSDPSTRGRSLHEDLLLLEIQVISADREAVRLAYRLSVESDGHYSEMLDAMLGRLIRIDPKLFLQELKRHRSQVSRLDSLLGQHGRPYIDRHRARSYEDEQRIAALMTIADPSLKDIRDECVGMLKKR